MSSCLELFYAKTLRNRIHCPFILTFFVHLFLERVFMLTVISNMNHFQTNLFNLKMGPLTGSTTPAQNEPWSNDNEGVPTLLRTP